MTAINASEALEVLRNADEVYSAAEVEAALDRMAAAINERFSGLDPVILVVMNGALIPAAQLLLRLNFPFQIGYLHATRYRGDTRGADLHWVARPSVPVKDRIVLVVDDIFDEGTTLAAIIQELRGSDAAEVHCAVLVNKIHDRKVKLDVEYVGLEVEDRYVFGCGMDYKEYLRHLPGIYAVGDS